MGKSVRVRLDRYPNPPVIEHFVRVYFKVGAHYTLPEELALDLVEEGDATFSVDAPPEVPPTVFSEPLE
jgi:hypothetical protein